jgi:hypothetical protein
MEKSCRHLITYRRNIKLLWKRYYLYIDNFIFSDFNSDRDQLKSKIDLMIPIGGTDFNLAFLDDNTGSIIGQSVIPLRLNSDGTLQVKLVENNKELCLITDYLF